MKVDTHVHPQARRPAGRRRGSVLVWVTILMMVILGFTALAVDVGHIYVVQADLQLAADSAALAGAESLTKGQPAAQQRAIEFAAKNNANGGPVNIASSDVELGLWNSVSQTFTPLSANSTFGPDAVRVTARLNESSGNSVGLHFARALGLTNTNVAATSIAWYRSRDIVLVLDFSASMNDDSEFVNVDDIGASALYSNLYQMYIDLGMPTYGNMQFDPVYISSNNVTTVRNTLGLSSVPYPYPSGSWNDYIDYVMNDDDVEDAGYRKRYGYMTLIEYWLAERPAYSQTPDLWKASAQPVTAVKNAVTLFVQYISQVETNDKLGLVSYTYSDSTAVIESGLTSNFSTITGIANQRQAGHYDQYTNIGAGILKARQELQNNGRPGSFKMIVLLTDGVANRPSNTTAAKAYTLQQAQAAADAGYTILSISLGAGADQDLMQDVADITGGVHFNVPGGSTVAAYTAQLNDVFRQVAAHRPLKLVN